ncbi:MAG TPA: M20/M25/M40 family metallo-hydrolase [Gemmatimonadales bacterium]|jgi:acetylornithine deacetylase/succinyl-diaminopimelate desuccinylase-like protein|nr:M20/M25/M40 family metallo-hydrolase [Gemmatimonadales bacterium]
MNPIRLIRLAGGLAVLLASGAGAQAADWHARTRAMFQRVIAIPTVTGRGRVPDMARYLAGEFRAAGWPDSAIRIMPYDSTAALIVRWPAVGPATGRPIMVLGHMDVVEARRDDWSTDPFTLTERDGYYYGRGTTDMKDGIVQVTEALIRLRAEGFRPRRDIIVFFTGDEETESDGARLGATRWKRFLDAEYGLNADAGGGGFTRDGRALGFTIQSAEKTYTNYTFTVRNRGGHSSKPRPDNAIYQLAAALERLAAHRFGPTLNETTRSYFTERQKAEPGALGDAMRAWLRNPADSAAADVIEADEGEVGLTRTRCVATRLFGGHADNALPQIATANINCRIMPGVDPDSVLEELRRVVADTGVGVTRDDHNTGAPPSPLRPDVVAAYTKAVRTLHPGAPVFAEMSTGATDGHYFRAVGMPIYGVGGSWIVVPDDIRAHGRDERLPVKALDDGVEHWRILLTELAGK